MRNWYRVPGLLLLAVVLTTAGCTSDTVGSEGSTTTAEGTTSGPEPSDAATTTGPTSTVDTSEPVTETSARERQVEVVDDAALTAPDSLWSLQDESFYVWGVELGDVLNVRSGPGVVNEIVATIAPDSGLLRIYDNYQFVGNTSWVPVQIADDGRVGWVSTQFLKPEPPAGSPIIQGNASPEILALMDRTLAALKDPAELATLVGSQGLTLSPFASITEETLTLSKEEIATQADQDRNWGTTSGEGAAIVLTLNEYLDGVRSRAALVSTVEIGYDEIIGGGNSINNIAAVFPDATVVEYNHPGTNFFGGLDWTSVRFVFDDDNGALVLRALVSDQWEI